MVFGSLKTRALVKTTGLTMQSRLYKELSNPTTVMVGRVTNITVVGGTTSYTVAWRYRDNPRVVSQDVFHYTNHEGKEFWVTTLATKNVQVEVQD